MVNQPFCEWTGYGSVGGDRIEQQSGFYCSNQVE